MIRSLARRSAALVAAVVLVAAAGCAPDRESPGPSSVDVDTPELREMKAAAGIEPCVPGPGGGGLPELTLPCLGGGDDVDLSSLTGPMILNVWNTACGPCRKEMPALQKFHEAYGSQVPVLGLDVTDTQPEMAISFAELVGATYPQLADPGGDLFDQPDLGLAPGFPQFIFLDAEGDVAAKATGGVHSVAEVRDLVREHLGITL